METRVRAVRVLFRHSPVQTSIRYFMHAPWRSAFRDCYGARGRKRAPRLATKRRFARQSVAKAAERARRKLDAQLFDHILEQRLLLMQRLAPLVSFSLDDLLSQVG